MDETSASTSSFSATKVTSRSSSGGSSPSIGEEDAPCDIIGPPRVRSN